MCVLHIKSNTDSFKKFIKQSNLPIYSSHEKGGERFKGKRPPHNDYGFSCDVSTKEWNDFPGQVEDSIKFLKNHILELKQLIESYSIDDIRLDFPVECRLVRNELFTQCDYLPPELIKLAGQVGIGIEISQYWPSEDDNNS
jgi:hypothetical protein